MTSTNLNVDAYLITPPNHKHVIHNFEELDFLADTQARRQSIDVEDPATLLDAVMGNEGATVPTRPGTTINHEPPEAHVMSSESHVVIHRRSYQQPTILIQSFIHHILSRSSSLALHIQTW
uniref:Uncharacterized protein n=1 Tax=Brassica oleracea TaxID=3712 RepID=A0A3P6E1B4_BRAOL|nr:unnamed protein product [Brassica oleracea]